MLLKSFTVYDAKAEAYMQPFFTSTIGLAVRIFTEALNDPNHQFNKYKADYTLFSLGSFDDAKGLFDTAAPISIGNGLEFCKTEETPQ